MASRDMDTSTPTVEDSLICPYCHLRFSSRGCLRDHFSLIHNEEITLVCDLCSKSFAHPRALEVHLLLHRLKPHICDKCGASFGDKISLKRHRLIHTGRHNYVCGVCKKAFARKAHLDAHATTHSYDMPRVCKTCNKVFPRKKDLAMHKIFCEYDKYFSNPDECCLDDPPLPGEDARVCPLCKGPFLSEQCLRQHQFVHTSETQINKHVSDMCTKSYARLSALKLHRIIRYSREHICNTCSKRFYSKVHYIKHRLMHRREKKHVCDLCQMSFRYQLQLEQHLLTHSEEMLSSAMNCLALFKKS